MTNLPTATATVDDVQMAEAVALLPPRPDAIVTLLTSDNFLPGAQTLLYSLKVSTRLVMKQPYLPVCAVSNSLGVCFFLENASVNIDVSSRTCRLGDAQCIARYATRVASRLLHSHPRG